MSGYKETIIESNPVVFFTFDSTRYDKSIRKSLDGVILDESGNERHGEIRETDSNSRAYRLGCESLIALEREDNMSICFCHYDRLIYLPEKFTPAWVYVEGLPLPTIKEATLECHFRKYKDFDLPSWEGHYHYTRPFISGYGFDLEFVNSSRANYNAILHCGGADYTFSFTYGDIYHLVITIKDGAAKIYLNCIDVTSNIASHSTTYWSRSPHLAIGGYPSQATTGMLYIDQFALYDYVLSDYDIARHYKKTKCYTDIIVTGRPTYYWTLSDDLTKDNTIRPLIGQVEAKPLGMVTTFDRNDIETLDLQILINEIKYNACLYIPTNSHINVKRYGVMGNTVPFVNDIKGEYTVEFWAKFGLNSGRQACVFSMQDADYPYVGWNLMLNTKHKEFNQGTLEFTETQAPDARILTSDEGFYNDNSWRHYCVAKRKNVLELWINGTMVASNSDPAPDLLQISNYGCLRIGGLPFSGRNSTEMFMYGFGIYFRALSSMEIVLRSSYSYTYEINGVVTLQGQPTVALVRVYNFRSGEFITQTWSEGLTGEYRVKLHNNNRVNVVIFNPNNPNVMYRVYTNITPYQIPDYLVV